MFSLVPPHRFAVVEPQLYRGAYPTLVNFRHLETLRLATVISLIPEAPTDDLRDFCTGNDIHHVIVNCDLFKDHEPQLLPSEVNAILGVVLDVSNYPVYIHCLDGKQTTGLVVMALRSIMLWDEVAIQHEYERFSKAPMMGGELGFLRDYKGDFLTKPPDASMLPPWLWGVRISQGSVDIGDRDWEPTNLLPTVFKEELTALAYGDQTPERRSPQLSHQEGRHLYVCPVNSSTHNPTPYGCDPYGICSTDRRLWEFAFGSLTKPSGSPTANELSDAMGSQSLKSLDALTDDIGASTLPSLLTSTAPSTPPLNAPLDLGSFRQYRHPTLPKFHVTTPPLRELPVAGKTSGTSSPVVSHEPPPPSRTKAKSLSPVPGQSPLSTPSSLGPMSKPLRPFGGPSGKAGAGTSSHPPSAMNSPPSVLLPPSHLPQEEDGVVITRMKGSLPLDSPSLRNLQMLLALKKHPQQQFPRSQMQQPKAVGEKPQSDFFVSMPPIRIGTAGASSLQSTSNGQSARSRPLVHNALLCMLVADEHRCRALYRRSLAVAARREMELLAAWVAMSSDATRLAATSQSPAPSTGATMPVPTNPEVTAPALGKAASSDDVGSSEEPSQAALPSESMASTTTPSSCPTHQSAAGRGCTLKEYLLAFATAPKQPTGNLLVGSDLVSVADGASPPLFLGGVGGVGEDCNVSGPSSPRVDATLKANCACDENLSSNVALGLCNDNPPPAPTCCDHLSAPLQSAGVSVELSLFAPTLRLGLLSPSSMGESVEYDSSFVEEQRSSADAQGSATGSNGVLRLLRQDFLSNAETSFNAFGGVAADAASAATKVTWAEVASPKAISPEKDWFPLPRDVLSEYSRSVPLLHHGHCHHNLFVRSLCTPLLEGDKRATGEGGVRSVGVISTRLMCTVHKDTPCFLTAECEAIPPLALDCGCAHLRHSIPLTGLGEALQSGAPALSPLPDRTGPTADTNGVGGGAPGAGGGTLNSTSAAVSQTSSTVSQGATSSAPSTSSRSSDLLRKPLRRRRSY